MKYVLAGSRINVSGKKDSAYNLNVYTFDRIIGIEKFIDSVKYYYMLKTPKEEILETLKQKKSVWFSTDDFIYCVKEID